MIIIRKKPKTIDTSSSSANFNDKLSQPLSLKVFYKSDILRGIKPSIEHGLTSPITHYRLSGRQFHRSKDPTNGIKVLKENATKVRKTQKTKQHKIQQHNKETIHTKNTASPLVYTSTMAD